MDKISTCLFVLLGCFLSAEAQTEKIDLEINVFRLGSEAGPKFADHFYLSYQLIPDISTGITINEKHRIFLKFRRLPSEIESATFGYKEQMSVRGADFSAGYEHTIAMSKHFSFLPTLGIFYDYARLRGTVSTDHPYDVEINNKRHFYGIYPELKFGIKLNKKMKIIVGNKARIGYMNSESIEPTKHDFSPYGSYHGFCLTADLVSTVSLRYYLK